MIVLDTDHLTVLRLPSSDRRDRLVARMALSADQEFAATIVSVEEQLRGWLATIAKERQPARLVRAYRDLGEVIRYYMAFRVVPFDDAAAGRFDALAGVRLKAMDKKIAAITLVNDALLLTANRRDFGRVPGLRFDNWMDG